MGVTSTEAELGYLRRQRFGGLATVDADGRPRNNRVGVVSDASGDVLIGGLNLAATRQLRNPRATPHVIFVVDDLASFDPWVVRGVDVQNSAQALPGVEPPRRGMSREVIGITTQWIGCCGTEAGRGTNVRREAHTTTTQGSER